MCFGASVFPRIPGPRSVQKEKNHLSAILFVLFSLTAMKTYPGMCCVLLRPQISQMPKRPWLCCALLRFCLGALKSQSMLWYS